MMSNECTKLNELLITLYGTKNKEEAFRRTLENLKKIIPFDRGDIYFYDSSKADPKINTFLSTGWPEKELEQYLEHYYLLDDVLPLLSSRTSIMFRSSDIFSSGDRMKSDYYLKALRPMGIEYSIEGSICCIGTTIGGIGLHRGKRDGEFTLEDVEFMKMISPHLRTVAADYIMSADDLPQSVCINAENSVGYVLWNQNCAVEWENLAHIGICNTDKTYIFNKLFAMSRKLQGKSSVTQSISIKRNVKEKELFMTNDYLVTVSQTTYHSKLHFCSVIIDFNKIMNSMFESIQKSVNLTKRELEVICMAMNGAETADIAKAFFVDVSTVKKHLTNSYQKMGIKGKHQIINFLLRGGEDFDE